MNVSIKKRKHHLVKCSFFQPTNKDQKNVAHTTQSQKPDMQCYQTSAGQQIFTLPCASANNLCNKGRQSRLHIFLRTYTICWMYTARDMNNFTAKLQKQIKCSAWPVYFCPYVVKCGVFYLKVEPV